MKNNKNAGNITAIATATSVVVTAIITHELLKEYRESFNKLKLSVGYLNEAKRKFNFNVNPMVNDKLKNVYSVIKGTNIAEVNFNFNLRIIDIVHLKSRNISIKDLNDLNRDVENIVTYVYTRHDM